MKKGFAQISALLLIALLVFLAVKLIVPGELFYNGYPTCVIDSNNVCKGSDIKNTEPRFGLNYLPRTGENNLPYKDKSIDYSQSYCIIKLQNNPFSMSGDPCNGVKCELTDKQKLVETPYGPACPVKSREYWKKHISDTRWCCTANRDWTIGQVYGIDYIKFNIVEKVEQQPQNETTPPVSNDIPQTETFWEKIINFFKRILNWFFGG